MAVSTEEIISAIDGMTILELKALSDALKEKYGVAARTKLEDAGAKADVK